MKMVHGPGPKRGSMDPWSMFCPHPSGPTGTRKGILVVSLMGEVGLRMFKMKIRYFNPYGYLLGF